MNDKDIPGNRQLTPIFKTAILQMEKDQNGAGRPPNGETVRWRIDDADYAHLRDVVFELLSIDLIHYRTQQMERRLSTYLERSGYSDWTGYAQSLYQRPEEVLRFVEFLTINVSSFYRDADKWDAMIESVIPDILDRTFPHGVHAWSIGCSMGAEPYTLAMLLRELAPERRHKIYAGDIDPGILARAYAAGPYSANDLREMPKDLIEKYMVARGENQFFIRDDLRKSVTFEHFDLLQSASTRLYDLVVCQNLVIYFPPPVKERVFRSLVQTLKPGGILFIGSTETITNYRQYGFEYCAPSFYRRAA